MLECDALPHNIIWDVIENVFWCWKCFNCYYSFETFKDHKCFGLNKVIEPHEFGWVLPVFGLLHLKMNAAWAFTKLNWDIFTSSLRATLGFKFLKAQVYIQKGSDHHKLWHFLEIMSFSLMFFYLYAIMVPYMRGYLAKDISPTVNDYWDWSKKSSGSKLSVHIGLMLYWLMLTVW